MATRTRRWVVVALLPLLSTAMRCAPEYRYDGDNCPSVPELENVKAYAAISPVKGAYKVGDTITCVLRADKKDWNNWLGFDKAEFHGFSLGFFDGETGSTTWPLSIPELTIMQTTATSQPDGERYVEQVTAYKLTRAGVYLLGGSYSYPRVDTKDFSTWAISYADSDESCSHLVPIYFKHNDKREMLLKVDE